ncbi:hypothetical protein ACPOL_2162 [Acidisarcina polymorpha]|uniref:Uncharacterized protein n=1 Tax=Acidisarcina polymorpha TaxID=2211140 RepID=A0A2Z5FYP2_9BACT|nr:hypothetical protein [Acidisarcina polymorpha]AXC11486.1 hypothetical protein ACPOL_2162 [Acidisarcina polymorpha]
MGFLSGIGDLVKQFAGNSGTPATGEQLTQLAGAVPQSSVAGGLAEVFRSGQTPPFAQLASQLFSNSNGQQQASVLNSLITAAGPGVLAHLAGNSSSPLASLLQGNQTQITPEQAAAVKPEEVQALAEHAEKADPSIIDKLSELYAAHPQLIQSLGAAAVTIAVQHIAKSHEASKA